MRMNRFSPFFRPLLILLPMLVLVGIPQGSSLLAQAAQPPASPPADWGPVSINLEDVPYPYPVDFMELSLFGQDLRLAYMDVAPTGTPNGRNVVLLHGASYYAMYWGDTIEELRSEGFRVVALDLLGWGRSSKPILPYSMHLHGSTIRGLLDHLGISETAIVGHSMGGMIATRFAFMYPDVTTHLVTVNQIGLSDTRPGRGWEEPSPNVSVDMDQVYQANLNQEMNRVVEWKPEFLEHVRIRYGWRLSGDWPRLAMVSSMNGNARSIDTVANDWPHIQTKAMVLGGEEDGPQFPTLARAIAETLPNAELVLFPNVGHNPHLEAPELFRPELIRFLLSDPDEPATADG